MFNFVNPKVVRVSLFKDKNGETVAVATAEGNMKSRIVIGDSGGKPLDDSRSRTVAWCDVILAGATRFETYAKRGNGEWKKVLEGKADMQ